MARAWNGRAWGASERGAHLKKEREEVGCGQVEWQVVIETE